MKLYTYCLSLLLVSGYVAGSLRDGKFSGQGLAHKSDSLVRMMKNCEKFNSKEGSAAVQTFIDKHPDVILSEKFEKFWESASLHMVDEARQKVNPVCKEMSERLRAFIIKKHNEHIGQ